MILNGTVSLMLVSQKYTMIPARIRSNANWLLLFKLNPVDFDNVYKDVVMMTSTKWDQLLKETFGDSDNGTDESKRYNNLGIWVEKDKFFQNFNEIKFG